LDPSASLCKYEDELGSIQAQQAYRTPDFEKSVSDRVRTANRKRDPPKNKKLSGRLPEIPPKSPVSLDAKPRRLKHKSDRQARSPNLQIRKNKTSFQHGLGMHLSHTTELPATPDISELEPSVDDRSRLGPASSFFQDTYTPQSGLSQNDSFDEVESPSDATDQEIFASSVATPPIAESDLEPFIDIDTAVTHASSGQRPAVNTAAQNASLPSPGLSPAYYDDFSDDNIADEGVLDGASPTTQSGDSQGTCFQEHLPRGRRSVSSHSLQQFGEASALQRSGVPTMTNSRAMIESFDAMPDEMKSLMMYQFLRRCHKKTLHLVANVVNPALKCDYLDELPLELSLHILTFLDHRDLCRAAQVSKKWRDVIDSNETGWKELFDRDGFVLPAGELEKAIKQGWGWQDPYGPDGYEQDFSVPELSSEMGSSTVLGYKVENEMVRKVRSGTKRKRTSNSLNPDRAKRNTEKVHGLISMNPPTNKFKSEGPLTAANVAAQAVPDPCVGLASLRKLHLYKSLYRRHSMLQRSWTSGKVAPHHFAFAAHPTHVITCLQFDDDKILTGSDDTMIHVYDTRTGALRNKLAGHDGGVWALQYEGNVLVSGSTDRSVRVWDIEKGLCTQVFHGHTSTVRCLQILMPEPTGSFENGKPVMLPEKPLIITGSRDSQLRVWRLPEQGSKRYIQTGPPANDADCPYFVRVLVGHSHSVRAIAAFQDTLVSGSYDSTVRVWKISTGETVHRLQGHAAKVYSVVLDHKRNRCISGSMDNFVKIWSLDTGACLFTLEGHSSLVGLLDLRDERLVSAAADSTLRIWDPENGQCKNTLTAHTGAITCFQHDGHKVISGSDRTLKMWNVKTGECIQDLLTDLSGVWQVKFDERRCVAAVQRHNLTYIEVGFLLPCHGRNPRC
jgi:F-box and WD-40 domain protein CDC4